MPVVTAVFRAVAPAILWLGLSSGDVLGTTPGHEVWTVEHGWTSAAYVHPGDTFVDRSGAPVTIESTTLDERSTPVHNLEVDGTFTYYADGVWVHNNSSCDGFARAHRPRSTYHKSGVWFDEKGFPDFSPHAKADVMISRTGTRSGDFAAANHAAGYADTPAGYTWHHHQEIGRMQLVPKELHRSVGHDGGWHIWGGK